MSRAGRAEAEPREVAVADAPRALDEADRVAAQARVCDLLAQRTLAVLPVSHGPALDGLDYDLEGRAGPVSRATTSSHVMGHLRRGGA